MFANSDNGGGTDWTRKTVPQMWSMLAAHDGTVHKDLLVTWKKSADLLIDHLSRVRRYRDNLAEAWPPEKNRAAAKYLDRLDDLIKHLTETHHATVENHRALGAATSALVGARRKLEPIYRTYLASQQEAEAVAARKRSNTETLGKYRIIAPPPLTPVESRQLQLHLQAQAVMSALSTDLAQAQLNITTPKLYDPSIPVDDSKPFMDSGGNSHPSPPSRIQSFPGEQYARSGHVSTDSGLPQPNNSIQNQGRVPSFYSPPIPQEVAPPNSRTSELAISELTPSKGRPTTSSTALDVPGDPSTSAAGGPRKPQITGITRSVTQANPIASAGNSSSPTRANQGSIPGGILGTPPGVANSRSGTLPPEIRRVNPVGGIIGQPGIMGGPPGPMQKLRPSRGDSSGSDHWNPEDPWATEKGVPPILLPPKKEKINPGPALGLPQ
ncbi:hypothetical protein Asi03nite_39340 [Actinoplanes siamensis]|uniref:Uncharacterized protein n=2 Tax=Actinoplanes siamensis TaxID=1223317 RepID=A0A919TKT9_9ACTN|nr:hypothetical protein Asi03nite_39340 [Actinoplanes siamensis]